MNNQEKKPVKILFVCLGNICRSPAAEGVFLEILRENQALERYTVDSAGTGGYHIGELPDSRMRVHARQRGLELVHHCRQVTTEDFEDFDLIIGMDSMNLTNLRRKAPSVEAARKIHGMAEFFSPGARYDHVPDPYYEGAEGFELVLDLLQDACLNLYNSLESEKRN
ncbi:MAG: low molecular weight phosphotyrosine protein phosphatase [Bacteroidales bacterium]|nr:low molecular weight phosphotyrosine protein phosphatase [Bacteroidales bacterium]MBD5281722.1 low molecular weight phosphotyrosine protein phosphatase [Bacteroides sp.]MBD5352502.1 low molecular weight phosphotyrosine protein phosphatase [Bacteroides sp.]MBD5359575.1 low molecular weight phosphotyrosine protein phosphatase [Bacteroides sp.]MBD5362270.1 low molecular weight phosphotyrosine protein phosphatase [Bacteroides sp.]